MSVLMRMLALLALVVVAPRASDATAADGHCWADWTDAAPIVRKQALRPAKEIADSVRARGKDVVKMTLCEEKGRFVYRLVIVGAGGKVENVTVDALKPF